MKKVKMLYIIYFDIDEISSTASKVRPKKIYEALKRNQVEVKVLSGNHRDFKGRRQSIREILKWLESHDVDLCYIELPSGPLFHPDDRALIRVLHKKGIKTSVFYRDLYWMFPNLFTEGHDVLNVLKGHVIRTMQKRDLRLLKENIDLIYIPSNIIGTHLQLKNFDVLPPGCDNTIPIAEMDSHDELRAVYVGGASERYGTHLLLDSVNLANEEVDINLTLVCPEKQWKTLPAKYQAYESKQWLNLKHLSSDELPAIYKNADIGIIPLLKNTYNDFAVPVKMYEYVSYGKPILATDCRETAEFIVKNDIGMVVEDNTKSMSEGLKKLYYSRATLDQYQDKLRKAFHDNIWDKRAEKILKDLVGEL